ncbi:hypothetical protein OUZ56_022865 [Daphnia magna]|uniref:Uncharacterized protein n=1 Tax=Daphnia magna TaxID=35525 RepID=A0ABR0AXP0_9CRUS|nr:hypothetical protein OUZ56_022865 [Daphnia magna]
MQGIYIDNSFLPEDQSEQGVTSLQQLGSHSSDIGFSFLFHTNDQIWCDELF